MPAPKVKICGLTRPEDARHAVEHGAWALGLIFWPGSARRCELDAAQEIAAELRRQAEIVGVFVDATLDEVAATAETVPLSMVQLHGREGPAYASEVARRTGAKVIKAARVRGHADIDHLTTFHTDFHLLDAYRADQPGGTGETFAWELAARRRSRIPLILSGGLTPENVAEGIAAMHPFAVDVASGTEAAPGVKDPAKVEAFIAAARATAEAPA